MKKIIIGILVAILILSISVSATTVSRSLSSNSVNKNTDTIVILTVDVTSYDTYYVIDEKIPSSTIVKSASNGGDYTTTTGHIFWYVLSGAQDVTYTYTINSGSQEGTFSFTGTYGSETQQEQDILGQKTLIVGTGGTINNAETGGGMGIIITAIVIIGIIYYFMKKK